MKPHLKNGLAAVICAATLTPAQAETAYPQDKLVIAASKAQSSAEDFAGTVSVVTAADIQLSGARNVLEAIATLPGVSASKVSGGKSGISIRGMETNHTLILVDGRRVSDTDTNVPFADYAFNWVPMSQIERIEVVRGPVSNLYGSAALGGVINIITRKSPGHWNTDVAVRKGLMTSGEGGDEAVLMVSAAGPLSDRVDLALSFEKRDQDAFREVFKGGDSVASTQGKEILNATFGMDIELSEMDTLGFDLIMGDEDRFNFPDTPDYQIDRRQTSLDYATVIAGFDVTGRAYRSESDNLLESATTGTANRDLVEDVYSVDLNGELNERNYLSAGFEYASEAYDQVSVPADLDDFSDEFSSKSAFFQTRTDLTDDVALTWGARYDDHERFGSEVSPKLYLNWYLNDAWQLKAGYGEGFKAPAIREASDEYSLSYGFPIGPGMFMQHTFEGNGNLKPETSKTFELGLNYSRGDLNGGITLFNNDVENLISTALASSDFDGTTITNVYRYQNVANATIRGVEAELGYQFTRDLDASFNLTLTDHEDDETGNWLTNRAQFDASLVVSQMMPAWGMSSRLAWNYTGKQYEDTANSDETPGVHTVDLSLRKAITPDISAQLGVYNLFDQMSAADDDAGSTHESGRLLALTLNGTF